MSDFKMKSASLQSMQSTNVIWNSKIKPNVVYDWEKTYMVIIFCRFMRAS